MRPIQGQVLHKRCPTNARRFADQSYLGGPFAASCTASRKDGLRPPILLHVGLADQGDVRRTPYNRSVSPARGCHFINRVSTRPTSASSTSANAVSTTMPAITVLMSKLPSACRMR